MFNMFEEKLLSILHNFAEVKDGVCEMVRVLRAQGLKIGSTTGYNDKMMSIVVPAAKANGYAPGVWFSPDSVGGAGRPKPYMIFKNMEALGLCDVRRVLKVGIQPRILQKEKMSVPIMSFRISAACLSL